MVFLGTLERVRNSRGKRAIGVRVIAVLLYFRKGLISWVMRLTIYIKLTKFR